MQYRSFNLSVVLLTLNMGRQCLELSISLPKMVITVDTWVALAIAVVAMSQRMATCFLKSVILI